MELDDIDGIGGGTVDKLKDVGIETAAHAAVADEQLMLDAGVVQGRVDKIKNAVGNGLDEQSGSEAQQEEENRTKVSTGVSGLDDMLGGGWEAGFVYTIFGPPGTGKSQLCFQSLVAAVDQTADKSVYIETEPNRYRSSRLQTMAENADSHKLVSKLSVNNIDEQEQAYNQVRLRSQDVSLVVVDSFNAAFRGEFSDRSDLSNRATVMKRHMDDIHRLATERDVPVILTGQIYSNPQQYASQKKIGYGGSVLRHSTGALMRLSEEGELSKVSIEKHPGIGKESTTMRIDGNGITSV